MSKQYFILPFILLFTISAYTQGNCSRFYPMKEGAHFTLTMYDADETELGKITYKVLNVSGNSGTYSTTMEAGGMSMSSEYGISCERDGVSIDFSSMGGGMMSRFGGGAGDKVDITGTSIYLPNDIAVGDVLPDAKMEMKLTIRAAGVASPSNTVIEMVDRNVIDRETITTPAGSFDCFVMTYQMLINGVNTAGLTHKMWLAPDVGVVKTMEVQGVDPTTGEDIHMGKALLTDYQL